MQVARKLQYQRIALIYFEAGLCSNCDAALILIETDPDDFVRVEICISWFPGVACAVQLDHVACRLITVPFDHVIRLYL